MAPARTHAEPLGPLRAKEGRDHAPADTRACCRPAVAGADLPRLLPTYRGCYRPAVAAADRPRLLPIRHRHGTGTPCRYIDASPKKGTPQPGESGESR
jgi:hypothetical protein